MRREGSSVGREFSGWPFQSRYHYMQSYTISYTLIQQIPTSPRLLVTPVCYVGNSRYMRGVDAMHGLRALKGLKHVRSLGTVTWYIFNVRLYAFTVSIP